MRQRTRFKKVDLGAPNHAFAAAERQRFSALGDSGVDEHNDEWAVNEASGGVAAVLARRFWPIRAVEARSFRKAVARICSGTLGRDVTSLALGDNLPLCLSVKCRRARGVRLFRHNSCISAFCLANNVVTHAVGAE